VEVVEGLGMKRNPASGLATIVLVVLGSTPVKAENVTWYFRGTVTQSNVGPVIPYVMSQMPRQGSTIAGLINFSTPPPQTVSAPFQTHAVWSNTISGVRLLHPFSFWRAGKGTIIIDDNSWSGFLRFDSIHFVAGDDLIPFKFDMRLEQSAIGPTMLSAVKSINVPSKPPSLSSLDIATFTFHYDAFTSFSGNVSQLKRYIEATSQKPK
jgi:hypothetical protein